MSIGNNYKIYEGNAEIGVLYDIKTDKGIELTRVKYDQKENYFIQGFNAFIRQKFIHKIKLSKK